MDFGGVDNKLTSHKTAKVVVIPVPYEKTARYGKGTKTGPRAILNASNNMELFDEELNKETYRIGIHTKSPLKTRGLSPEKMVRIVEKAVCQALEKKKFPIVIGGEHSVPIGAVKAVAKKFKALSVLHLDAHADLRDKYSGSKYSHACFARRALEASPVVQVGIRSMSKEEKNFLPHPDVCMINAYEIQKNKKWMKKASQKLSKNVYVSIDLDVFDPSLMPSTGTPEPGGMGWYDAIGFLRKIAASHNIVGFDVVELSPRKGEEASDFLAAKLIYRFLGYIFAK